jgi:hypothetical protein
MSETTELKSIEEIARETWWAFDPKFVGSVDVGLCAEKGVELAQAVRDSDRQHWLEVACKAMCEWCRDDFRVREWKPETGWWNGKLGEMEHVDLSGPWPCDATKIRSAFTAQEKKD